MKHEAESNLLLSRLKARYLYLIAFVLIFAWLGGREIWTQEYRWADIVTGMFTRHDFFHPYLGEQTYYDKPLLSYWLIAALAKISGGLSTWSLRMPSALSGLLAVWSMVRLGTILKNKELGVLAGAMLLTTFYFIFWARTSSADMLNLGGSLFAITWYMMKRDHARFFDFVIFFLVVALTSLCKGCVAAVIVTIAVITDMVLRQTWKRYLTWTVVCSMVPGIIVYLAPFIISNITNTTGSYNENGLYLVYRENILRYFQPFDHQGPFYTYLIYLPIYTLPWVFFLVPALVSLPRRWSTLSLDSRWVVWTFGLLFAFFSISGSRRSYYILPVVPFVLLLISDWLLSSETVIKRYYHSIVGTIVAMLLILFIGLDFMPTWLNNHFGATKFAKTVSTLVGDTIFSENNVLMLDADSKLNFYLHLPLTIKNYSLRSDRNAIKVEELAAWWPILKQYDLNKTIIITRRAYIPYLQPYLKDYRVAAAPSSHVLFLPRDRDNESVALIPIYMR